MRRSHTTRIMQRYPKVQVGPGVPVTACKTDDAMLLLAYTLATSTAPKALATVNLDFLRLAAERRELRETLKDFDHCFADGWPVITMARLQGVPMHERVTGSDLTPLICKWAGEYGWKVGFVGASEQVKERLAEVVPQRYGNILAGHWTLITVGRSGNLSDPALAAEIKASGAQILLVALGCPKQEYWIRDNLDACGARVAMGVGASLDFLAGVVHRAPPIWQRLHMEFLYRFIQEPKRLGLRYYRDWRYYRHCLNTLNSFNKPGQVSAGV